MPLAILEIIRLLLAIILEAMQGMTPEQKASAWERHEKRVEFWSNLFQKEQAREAKN